MQTSALFVLQYHNGAEWLDVDGVARPYGDISHYSAPRGTSTRLRRA